MTVSEKYFMLIKPTILEAPDNPHPLNQTRNEKDIIIDHRIITGNLCYGAAGTGVPVPGW